MKTTQPENSWKKAFSRLRSDVVRRDAGARDPGAGGDDRHRHGHPHDREAHPEAPIREVAVEDRQRHERDERSDAATGLRHLERCVREDEDVPLAEDRDVRGGRSRSHRSATRAVAAGRRCD